MPHIDHEERRAVFVIAATPSVPSGSLMASVFAGAASVFGVRAIDDVATGPGMTALLTITRLQRSITAAASAALTRTLVAGIASNLSGRGFTEVVVEVEGLGTLLSSGPFREVAEHWVGHLGNATTVTAPSHSYEERIADLIARRAIRTLFQPIVEASTGEVVGYEALSRGPRGDSLEGAWQLLDAARLGGLEEELSVTMAHLARRRAARLFTRDDLLLFVNVEPTALWRPLDGIGRGAGALMWPSERTVVELTERTPINDVPAFLGQRDVARSEGVRFALDDAGAGFSGLATLALLAPDFIKVDMGLVRDCDRDVLKRSVIDALVYLSDRSGSMLIAEGVETERELDALRSLGVHLVQGFLVAEPAELPPAGASAMAPEVLGRSARRIRDNREARVGT